jgi:hypothetical protein
MKSVIYFLVIILVGALLGDFIGKALAMGFPQGSIHDLFATQLARGIKPTELDLGIIDLTFGCMFKFNITGVIGILLAAFLSRAVFTK